LPSDTFQVCNGCHVLDPQGNASFGVSRPGFFGSDGRYTFDNETQFFKIPHLRNAYQKVGMFGMADNNPDPAFCATSPFAPFTCNPVIHLFVNPGDNDYKGDQVRGFGYLHDGSFDTLFRFHSVETFDPRPPGTLNAGDPGNPGGFTLDAAGMLLRRQVQLFILAFDSNMAPIVGQQVTLTDDNAAVAGPRIDLLIARANASECDLTAKASISSQEAGYLYVGAGVFATNRAAAPPIADADLRALASIEPQAITYTCVPPGEGQRIALDRDGDGYLDGDEHDAGSDPADPHSWPGSH
jgi:hypothetical protein